MFISSETSTSQSTKHSQLYERAEQINISGPITIESWIKPSSVNGNYQALCAAKQGDSQALAAVMSSITNTAKVQLDLYQSHNQYTTAIGSTTMTTVALFVGRLRRPHEGEGLTSSISHSSGHFFFVRTLIAIGVIGLFWVILSARGLWSLPCRRPR